MENYQNLKKKKTHIFYDTSDPPPPLWNRFFGQHSGGTP